MKIINRTADGKKRIGDFILKQMWVAFHMLKEFLINLFFMCLGFYGCLYMMHLFYCQASGKCRTDRMQVHAVNGEKKWKGGRSGRKYFD